MWINKIADIFSYKKLNPIVTELFIIVIKLNISSSLLHNLVLLFQKKSGQNLHTISLSRLQINDSFNKSYLIIHQILIIDIRDIMYL